jgi:hypothetical protein
MPDEMKVCFVDVSIIQKLKLFESYIILHATGQSLIGCY